MSPQIVTETLYALAVAGTPAWVPDEVRIITTASGAREAELNLLSTRAETQQPGWFHRLLSDYRLPAITFDAERIHVVCDSDGKPLDDIRSPAENERVADFITDIVRNLTRDATSELHVSIAGGRKSMGYYLGYALSLFGRPQDRLSHVLVSAPFENNRDFYYPTPYRNPISVRSASGERTYDAREARVDLAAIPFVRLRDGLPPRLFTTNATLTATVAAANRALQPAHLRIDVQAGKVWADDTLIELTPIQLAVLLWLAENAKAGIAHIDWTLAAAFDSFKRCAERVINSWSGTFEKIDEAAKWRQGNPIKQAEYFEPHKSNINKAFATALGKAAAVRYQMPRGINALPLAPEQIEITD